MAGRIAVTSRENREKKQVQGSEGEKGRPTVTQPLPSLLALPSGLSLAAGSLSRISLLSGTRAPGDLRCP